MLFFLDNVSNFIPQISDSHKVIIKQQQKASFERDRPEDKECCSRLKASERRFNLRSSVLLKNKGVLNVGKLQERIKDATKPRRLGLEKNNCFNKKLEKLNLAAKGSAL